MSRTPPEGETFYEVDHVDLVPASRGTERYSRTNLIGTGGMGQVHAALDNALGRVVALKEARPDAGPDIQARLEREARMTAALDHPGIVAVHDVGRGPDGRPWYTMRLVRGESLADHLLRASSLTARLPLVRHLLDATQAVAWAHAHGTVHRDLKPDNIMVGEMGETQVVDWGLAVPSGTAAGLAGTPAYMSPEQGRGGSAVPTDDVWAFGAILYEVLTGQAPRATIPSGDLLTRIAEPIAPLPTGLPPELVTITQKCLQEDPAQRYPSARELSSDLARWIDGRPVEAHRYSAAELLLRAYRAWRAPILVGGVALVLFVGMLSYTTWRTAVQRDRATAAERETRKAYAGALAAHSRSAFADGAWPEAEVLAAEALLDGEDPEARGALAGIHALRRPTLLDEAAVPECLRTRLGATHGIVYCESADALSRWTLSPAKEHWRVEGLTDPVLAGDRVVAESTDGTIAHVLDATTGTRLRSIPIFGDLWEGDARWVITGGRTGVISVVALDHDETRKVERCDGVLTDVRLIDDKVLTVCDNGTLAISPIGGGQTHRIRVGPAIAGPVAWLANRETALAYDTQNTLWRIPLNGPMEPIGTLSLGTVSALLPTPDERFVLVNGSRSGAELWHIDARTQVLRLPQNESRDIRLDERGNVEELGRKWRSWALPADLPPTLIPLEAGASAVALSPDGNEATIGLGPGGLLRWGLGSGRAIERWTATDIAIKGVAYARGGVAYTGQTEGLRHRAASGEDRYLADWGFIRRLGLIHGDRLLGLSRRKRVLIWEGDATTEHPVDVGEGQELGVSPRGRAAVVVGSAGQVQTLFATGPIKDGPTMPAANAITATISDDGEVVYVGGPDGIRAWRGQSIAWSAPHPSPYPVDLALSGDERWLAAAGLDGAVRVYDTLQGRLFAVLRGHDARLSAVAFALDRPILASVGWDARLRVWDLSALDVPAAVAADQARTWWHMDAQEAMAAAAR